MQSKGMSVREALQGVLSSLREKEKGEDIPLVRLGDINATKQAVTIYENLLTPGQGQPPERTCLLQGRVDAHDLALFANLVHDIHAHSLEEMPAEAPQMIRNAVRRRCAVWELIASELPVPGSELTSAGLWRFSAFLALRMAAYINELLIRGEAQKAQIIMQEHINLATEGLHLSMLDAAGPEEESVQQGAEQEAPRSSLIITG